VESLICLALSLLVFIFTLDCFSAAGKHFHLLKVAEEARASAYAALDRMTRDISIAGQGLRKAVELGLLKGVEDTDKGLVIVSREEELVLEGALEVGQQRILYSGRPRLKKGQWVSVFDALSGETAQVVSFDRDSFTLSVPLRRSYPVPGACVISLRKVSLFFDRDKGTIRRKINTSSAQPLLEEVAEFGFEVQEAANLVRVYFKLNRGEEQEYGKSVFPKNTALAMVAEEE